MALILLLIVSFILHAGGGNALSTEPAIPPTNNLLGEIKLLTTEDTDIPISANSPDISPKPPSFPFCPIAAAHSSFTSSLHHAPPGSSLSGDNSSLHHAPLYYEDHIPVFPPQDAPTIHPLSFHSSYPSLLDVTAKTQSPHLIIQQQLRQLIHKKEVSAKNDMLFCPPLPPANGQNLIINSPTSVQCPPPFQPTTEPWELPSVPALSALVKHTPLPSMQKPLERLYHDMFARKFTSTQPTNIPLVKVRPIPHTKYPINPQYTSQIFSTSSSTPLLAIPHHVTKNTQHSKEVYNTPPPKIIYLPDSSVIIIKMGEEYSLPSDCNSSQAAEIIKEYNHKNSTFLGDIPLATRILEAHVNDEISHFVNQNVRLTQAFLAEIPSLSSLDTLSYNNEFETAIYYAPNEKGEGYDFVLKMLPSKKLYFNQPSKNIIFVIDESSSIYKHRFNTFKVGVTRALPHLKRGDMFNIIIHGTRMTFMHTSSVPWDEKAIETASRFLDSHRYKNSSAKYNTFELITQILPCCDGERENIFIILTDGKSLSSIESHGIALQQLITTNQDRHLSIFTASVSRDNNFLMLDLISRFNSGELIYSGTHASFPRKLATQIKCIGNLVARKISIQTTTDDNIDTEVKFYPSKHLLPPLYLDQPYIIHGSIKELKNFNLILQGNTFDKRWINIRQHISFEKAEKATHAMKQALALKRAHLCYNLFLQEADHTFLTEARRHLNPNLLPDLLK